MRKGEFDESNYPLKLLSLSSLGHLLDILLFWQILIRCEWIWMPGDKNWEVLCHGTLENWFSPLCRCLSIYEQYKVVRYFGSPSWVQCKISICELQYCCYLIAFWVGSCDIISLRIFSIIAQFSGVNNVIASVSNMVKA